MRLAGSGLIRRESNQKINKRRQIHNFPASARFLSELKLAGAGSALRSAPASTKWMKILSVLVETTDKTEDQILEEALTAHALNALREVTTDG